MEKLSADDLQFISGLFNPTDYPELLDIYDVEDAEDDGWWPKHDPNTEDDWAEEDLDNYENYLNEGN